MRPTALIVWMRLSLLVAIAASATLVVEYSGVAESAFCGPDSGCSAVRASSFAQWFQTTLGFSLPQLGLGAHLALLAGALLARTPAQHRLLAAATGAGALFGAVLMVMQATSIGAFCQWCVAVDLASISAGVFAFLLARQVAAAKGEPWWIARLAQPSVTFAWAIAGTAATALPFVWASYSEQDPLPPRLAELQVKGKVTIISFTDFECPFCRQLHPVMEELREKHGDKIHLVRRMVPLDMHPGAKPAALAYLCTPEAKRDQMADLLYSKKDGELNAHSVIELGDQIGQDKLEFLQCLGNPATIEEMDQQKLFFKSLEVRGLPATYVGSQVVEGFDEEKLRDAVERQIGGSTFELPVWAMVMAMAGIAVGVIVFTTNKAAEPTEQERQSAKRERKARRREEEDEDQGADEEEEADGGDDEEGDGDDDEEGDEDEEEEGDGEEEEEGEEDDDDDRGKRS